MHKCITVYERATVQILTISNNTVHYFYYHSIIYSQTMQNVQTHVPVVII